MTVLSPSADASRLLRDTKYQDRSMIRRRRLCWTTSPHIRRRDIDPCPRAATTRLPPVTPKSAQFISGSRSLHRQRDRGEACKSRRRRTRQSWGTEAFARRSRGVNPPVAPATPAAPAAADNTTALARAVGHPTQLVLRTISQRNLHRSHGHRTRPLIETLPQKHYN